MAVQIQQLTQLLQQQQQQQQQQQRASEAEVDQAKKECSLQKLLQREFKSRTVTNISLTIQHINVRL
ncbi:hypothetical protein G6F43_014091 [Rhizopus delemar]|nr:hypothetical protein G6F43_014091 [Rhizopus delemar]